MLQSQTTRTWIWGRLLHPTNSWLPLAGSMHSVPSIANRAPGNGASVILDFMHTCLSFGGNAKHYCIGATALHACETYSTPLPSPFRANTALLSPFWTNTAHHTPRQCRRQPKTLLVPPLEGGGAIELVVAFCHEPTDDGRETIVRHLKHCQKPEDRGPNRSSYWCQVESSRIIRGQEHREEVHSLIVGNLWFVQQVLFRAINLQIHSLRESYS